MGGRDQSGSPDTAQLSGELQLHYRQAGSEQGLLNGGRGTEQKAEGTGEGVLGRGSA